MDPVDEVELILDGERFFDPPLVNVDKYHVNASNSEDIFSSKWMCGVTSPSGLICTRDRGHSDYHAAHIPGNLVRSIWR